MLVNIAWNHSGWMLLEPNPDVGFGYTKQWRGAAFSPHEALNFDFSKDGIDSDTTVFGYFQTRGLPRKFVKGGLIFFWSRNTDDKVGYFVGVYGKADVVEDKTNKANKRKWNHPGFETGEFWANIQGEKKLSCRFPYPIDDSSYKTNGRRLIYRSNFSYDFDKATALQLLKNAMSQTCGKPIDSDIIATLTSIIKYVKDEL